MDENKRVEKLIEMLDLISTYIDSKDKANEFFNSKRTLYDLFFKDNQIRDVYIDIIPTEVLPHISNFISSFCASPSLSSWEIKKIKANILKTRDIVRNYYRREMKYVKKIFISHSSMDKTYGEVLVKLLRELGLNREEIIFTSNDDYGIPLGENIFDYLKKQIKEGVYILYLLSDNYYNSVACLNEMGAAWIVQNEYTVIGVPNFNFDNPKFSEGAIDPKRIGFNMDNKKRVVEFKNKILERFKLSIDEADWNNALDKYFDDLNNK